MLPLITELDRRVVGVEPAIRCTREPFTVSVEQYEEFFRREAILETWLRDQD